MKKKKPTTEEFWQEEQTYQTGSTNPPKNHGGIIAFLLVLVIFLCGISTALGLMNIHLFRQLSSPDPLEESCAVAFSDSDRLTPPITDTASVHFSLGFTGQGVPNFWQYYHDLPQGIYVTEVEESGAAQKGGLLPGDVLISLDSVLVPNTELLNSILEQYHPGDALAAVVFRSGNELSLTITIE